MFALLLRFVHVQHVLEASHPRVAFVRGAGHQVESEFALAAADDHREAGALVDVQPLVVFAPHLLRHLVERVAAPAPAHVHNVSKVDCDQGKFR